MSALVDGEAADDDVKQACVDWRGDAKARQSWHAYHLIGDVLRSDEARPPQRGATRPPPQTASGVARRAGGAGASAGQDLADGDRPFGAPLAIGRWPPAS